MKIAIIQFPGSNCEPDTLLAVKRAGMIPVEFLWNEPEEKLLNCQGYIIVGDGVIAASDAIIHIIRQQSEIGKPVLGICNGAQLLVESGFVPGIEDHKTCISLTENQLSNHNAWAHMRLSDEYQYNAFTRLLKPKQVLHLPVTNAKRRFMIPPALLFEMRVNGLDVFQYCDQSGEVLGEFPINPNGSVNNIAAVSNKNGNVMAIMPRPECTPAGDLIFNSMREYIAEGYKQHVRPLDYYPR